MRKVEKTVFISYRRTNSMTALAVYQHLTQNGYDVFFDYRNIDSGDFEQIILENIASRAHFIVILTPSALERCAEPGDWLRREIEYALDQERNIVPLMFEGFDYGSPSIQKYLTGKLAVLPKYNAQRVPADFFDEAMARVRERFLNIELDAVLHPRSAQAERAATQQQAAADAQQTVTEETLTAEEWFEKGLASDDMQEKLHCYTKAIELKPDYAKAYNNRGIAKRNLGDTKGAIADYTKSIEHKNPELHLPYNNRGIAKLDLGDTDGAIADFDRAIDLQPDFAEAYNNRGSAKHELGGTDGAVADYDRAIDLQPDYVDAYYNRGIAYYHLSDYQRAKADWEKALQLKHDYEAARNNLRIVQRRIDEQNN